MSKTLQSLLSGRPWIAHIDDERSQGNSIIVTLAEGCYFESDRSCGVMGFDTVAEVRTGTQSKQVLKGVQ